MTTTHFTNGVSNQTVGDPLYDYPYLDPFKFYSYSNDFFTYHSDEWTITTTEDGTGSATEALTSQSWRGSSCHKRCGRQRSRFLQSEGRVFQVCFYEAYVLQS